MHLSRISPESSYIQTLYVMAAHVPAWKRLGLKLKNERESPKTGQNSHRELMQQDEALEYEAAVADRPAKRRRFARNQETRVKQSGNSRYTNSDANEALPSAQTSNGANLSIAAAVSGQNSVKRKKSVSFTTDTKTDDGDSRITIDFPARSPALDVKESKLLDTEAHEVDQADILPHEADRDTNDSITRASNTNRSGARKKLKPGSVAAKDKGAQALEYLSQHRSNRELWKFNKNRDVWILSNALNVQSIPIEYCLALANYVAGLPEKAGARARLVRQCNDSFEHHRTEKDDQLGERETLLELLSDPNTVSDVVAGEFLKNHSRPAILLWALGREVPKSDQSTDPKEHSQPPLSMESSRKVKKRKKARVQRHIELSSSESESEGGDDDNADGWNTANGKDKIENDTSSSDSETSSSNSTSSVESTSASDSSE